MILEIAEVAVQSLIAEVFTTPKPGLVDLFSNGAHKDMNVQTFLDSTKSLRPYFYDIAKTASVWNYSLPTLFNQIRKRGVTAEKEMFAATNGINTHKGLIFSEGILVASAAYSWAHFSTLNSEYIFSIAKEMVFTSLETDFTSISKNEPQTHGEKLFVQYGYKGIRGEAQNAFPSVRSISLPALTAFLEQGRNENISRVQTLFLLMESVDDTNILYRSDCQTLMFVKETASNALKKGGAFTSEGLSFIESLDKVFIEKNISPGGCADLLAVTIMMHNLQSIEKAMELKNNSYIYPKAALNYHPV